MQLTGVPTSDLIRGGGRVWHGDASDFQWTSAEAGVIRGWLVAYLSGASGDDANPLFVFAQCSHSSEASGGGVRIGLSNYGQTPGQVVIDDGVNPPQLVSLPAANASYAPIVRDTSRRIVLQGVRGTDEFFFASVFAEHQDDACRSTATGYLVH